ncbi:MAG: ion channel [Candidatus Thermoplasmatota archaeon]|jgi:voltage-gated potassium channel|nr:ion channel [Candidatus Thermoplasmatota archaeon]
MFPFALLFKKLRKKLKGAFYGAITSTVAIVLYGTFSEYFIENKLPTSGIHSLFDSLWWVVQTITTVGYGDEPIVSFWGRVNGMFIMLVGIGSLGILTASIGANLVEMNLASKLGERRIKMKDHVIVCNSDEGLREVVREITGNGMEVVLVDEQDPKLSGVDYDFVKGKCSAEGDLNMAGVSSASKIVVLPERTESDASSADAKTILTTMVIRKLKKDAYIISEMLKEENRDHAVMAGANEVVVKGSMSTLLLANAVTSPGVSYLLYELLRGEDGYRIKEYSIDPSFKGKTCGDVYREMDTEGKVVLGFRSNEEIRVRPAGEAPIAWDSVVVMEPKK